MVSNINSLLHDDRGADDGGQALVEYAMILMLVAMVSVAVLTAIGQNVLEPLASIRDALL
jgi:Flp pilus assembly pilin Flp